MRRYGLTTAALAYLALPNILFLMGWVDPLAAIPLCLLILAGCWLIVNKSPRPAETRPEDGTYLATALVIAFIWVFLSGITGNSQQSYDFFVRNPIYETLVRCDWPIFSQRGEYFVYYFAFYLPPAVCAKLIGTGNVQLWDTLLFLWSYAGVAIVILLLHRHFKKYILAFLLIWIFFESFNNLGKILFDSAAFRLEIFWGLELGTISQWWEKQLTSATGATTQLYFTYHHAIPIWVVCALLLSQAKEAFNIAREQFPWKDPVFTLPLIASLGLLFSPLGSVGVLILLLFLLASIWNKRSFSILKLAVNPCTLAGIALTVCAALYFADSKGGYTRLLWQDSPWGASDPRIKLVSYFISLACTLAMPLLLLQKEDWKSPLGKTALTLAVGLPVIIVGFASNELLFKGAAPLFLLLSCLVCRRWSQAQRQGRIVLMAGVLLTAYFPAAQIFTAVTTLGFDRQSIVRNTNNPWKGHLNHPDDSAYPQFWGATATPFPLFLQTSGSSAQGLMKWCAVNNRSDTEQLPPAHHSPSTKRRPPKS